MNTADSSTKLVILSYTRDAPLFVVILSEAERSGAKPKSLS